jgi:hypothetical protein
MKRVCGWRPEMLSMRRQERNGGANPLLNDSAWRDSGSPKAGQVLGL